MNRRKAIKTTFTATALAAVFRPGIVASQEAAPKAPATPGNAVYLNPATGGDANPGTKDRPLRTLAEAARRVNQAEGTGSMTIILSEGVYSVDETTLLKPEHRSFSKTERLAIRAEILPDDADWHIGRMPTLIHTMPLPSTWNGRPDPLGGAANGMVVETSHVTIQGLKILGIPVVESPKPGLKRRLYAIARFRSELEDLEVSQCMFVGDELVAPCHVGIIANGNGVVVHHCIFRGFMKDPVVFWTPGSTGHAMRNCLFHGTYGSSVWASGIADDFDYRNNIVDSCNYVWIYQGRASTRADAGGGRAQLPDGSQSKQERGNRYKVVNSLFANNKKLAGTGTGARIEFAEIDTSFLEMVETKTSDQPVLFERDETKRNYLHPVAGSEASKIGAGLFRKPPE